MNRIVLLVLLVVGVSNLFARDIFVGGAGASDGNAGTAAAPFSTIQKAASVAVAGDVIKIRGGTYRETITPGNSGIVFEPDNGANVIISGLNVLGNDGWSVHSGNIYKKTVTLPVNGYNVKIPSNGVLAANQIFKDGNMVIEARWPKANNVEALFDRKNLRQRNSTASWNGGTLVDNGIPNIPGGWAGGKIWISGWYASQSATINSQSGGTITFNPVAGGNNFLQYYYLTGKLNALTQANEFHYENNTLYVWQPGGGSPTGIEYKARNWGFDLSGKTGITIRGIKLIGCDVNGNASTANITIDNIRATYLNHTFLQEGVGDLANVLYNNPIQTGFRLLGANNVVTNSEFKYAASNVLFVGKGNRVENNKFEWINYEGNYGAAVLLYQSSDNVKILKNTFSYLGRSAVDFGYVYDDHHNNVEIGYNDIMHYGMLSADGGGIYAARWQYLNGTRVHHNWIHNSLAEHTPSAGFANGINAGLYYDHATGSNTINDHNVFWDNKQCDLHISTTWHGEGRNDSRGNAKFYNNNCVTVVYDNYVHGYFSYLNVSQEYYDIEKNNIYRARNINVQGSNWADATNGMSPFNVSNCLNRATNPLFAGGSATPTTVSTPQEYFQLQTASPARNTGVVIAGITDGSVGVPDIGAYEYGGEKWTAGYSPVASVTPVNNPPVVSVTAPSNNATFAQGSAVGISANATDAGGSVTRVEFYAGTTKIGEDLTSPYSFSWTNAPVGTHSITAKATDNLNATTTSSAITITITANSKPSVNITAPTSNAEFAIGTAINVTAVATDVGGTVTKVEFFNGTTKLGEDTTSPYAFAWTGAAAGSYKITASATDNDGNSAVSPVVIIVVTATPQQFKPTISLTSPANNSEFSSGTPISIEATAADQGGSISKVEFYNGTSKLGEDTSSPYSFVWLDAPVGKYTITAKAIDNSAASTTSSPVAIEVKQPVLNNANPTVVLTSPANDSQSLAATQVNVTATANDADGTVTKVEFFANGEKIGEDTEAPFSITWNGSEPGSYDIVAMAYDNDLSTTSSPSVRIVISANSIEAPLEADLFSGIPRFFSPNGDGVGDQWIWGERPEYQNSSLQVSNRAGKVVYESAPYNNTWDGTVDGSTLQDGDYYYIIRLADSNVLKGAVRIIR